MIRPAPGRRRRFSARRRALLVLVLLLLALLAWLHFTGAAGISGMATKDMDWDNDGRVSETEILQSFYAVTVSKHVEGQRECSTYAWRDGGRAIRVDCRTVLQPEGKPEP